MNGPHNALANLKISGNLPSMPQVLVQLIDSCHDAEIPLQTLARLIDKDAAISAKVLQLVNSAFIASRKAIVSIEQAVVFLGLDAVRNLAISISVQQVFRRVETNGLLSIDRFWHHSYVNALLARNIATAVGYPEPSEAYLAGLLHDIGKLLLWMAFSGSYAPLLLKGVRCTNARLAFLEEEKLQVNHCQAGAWLCEQWRLPALLADAIRYHHHPLDEVAQALPLTKIVYLADLLSHSEPAHPECQEAAERLFHLASDQLAPLMDGLDEQLGEIATHLGIRIPANGKTSHDQEPENEEAHKETSLGLITRIRDISQLNGVLDNLLRAETRDQIIRTLEQGMKILFNEEICLVLLPAATADRWSAHPSVDNRLAREIEGFSFTPQQHADSLPTRALTHRRLLHSFMDKDKTQAAANLFDAQMLHLLGAEGMAAVPLIHQKTTEGLLLVGLVHHSPRRLIAQATPLQLLANHAAAALHLERIKTAQAEQIAAERMQAATLVARKIAHEINNPLAILRNYLHILRNKSRQGEPIDTEATIIDSELERIAQITHGLQDLARPSDTPPLASLALHPLIEETVTLFQATLPTDRPVQLVYEPAEAPLTAKAHAGHLRQILQNLLTNALDAIAAQGTITVRTRATESAVVIDIEDSGPGIDPAIQPTLFQAGVSTKSGRHGGLGLAITDKLARQMGGTIACASQPGATVFSLTLPA
jgi:HD-like signal output (HDOD) protein/signal transduction histidine kinase